MSSRLHWTRIDRQSDLPMVGERRLFRHHNGFCFYGRVISRMQVLSLNPKWPPREKKVDWWCLAAWTDDGSEDKGDGREGMD